MSVLSSRALHEQLSLIMATLTKAALAEICAAVDQSFAVLQTEISRSHKENQDLKKKMHLIESIVLKGSSGGVPVEEAAQRDCEAGTESPPTPRHEQRKKEEGGNASGTGSSAVDRAPQEFSDVVLIKDEDSDSNDDCEEDGRTSVDRVTRTPLRRGTKRHLSRTEDGSTVSSSSEHLSRISPNSGLNSNTHKSVSVYNVDSPHLDAVCSYSPQMDPDVHVISQDCSEFPSVSVVGNRPSYFSTNSALFDSQSPNHRAELDLSLTWNKTTHQIPFVNYHSVENTDAFGLKLVSVSGSIDSGHFSENSGNSAFECEDPQTMNGLGLYRTDQLGSEGQLSPASSKAKRFLCSVCNKTYATSQNLEVHMRIHTGERPFNCEHCGKKFTQSAHLKSHLTVHSGVRPYNCSVCSRSFIVQYSLKLHMKKCHPNI